MITANEARKRADSTAVEKKLNDALYSVQRKRADITRAHRKFQVEVQDFVKDNRPSKIGRKVRNNVEQALKMIRK